MKNIIKQQKKYKTTKKVSIPLEAISTISIYAPNNRVSKFMKYKLTEFKGKIGQ